MIVVDQAQNEHHEEQSSADVHADDCPLVSAGFVDPRQFGDLR